LRLYAILDKIMNSAEISDVTTSSTRQPLIEADSKFRPKTIPRLNDWQYLERSIHRMICAWGRRFGEWDDKASIHKMVWDQAECVRRLRQRVEEFPAGKPDEPVSCRLEALANIVLQAPSKEDWLDGVFQVLTIGIVRSYMIYTKSAHNVHDAPTIAVIHEICTIKEQHRLWLRDYRRRNPHTIDAAYKASIEEALKNLGNLEMEIGFEDGKIAQPCGVAIQFRPIAEAELPKAALKAPDASKVSVYTNIDFHSNIETRRIFWCFGYMLEINLADQQLAWIYDATYMPWAFHHDVSRHLWDESRHGQSGYSRFLDFGLTHEFIGFSRNNSDPNVLQPTMTPKDLYEVMYNVGMLAETSHFNVKNEAYTDFREGGDLESAEMMLFDIIDETTHVQYTHRWLPIIAKHAEVELGDYKGRAAQALKQWAIDAETYRQKTLPNLDCSPENPHWKRYNEIKEIMRAKKPFSNVDTCAPRTKLHYFWGSAD